VSAQTLAEMRALLARHGLRPSKALGQHFLADPNLTRRVVRTAGVMPGDRVLEVGAGTGTLTRALAEAGAAVLAIEVDPRLAPVLEESLGEAQVEVRIADALSFDYRSALGQGGWKMVSNLPYEVGTTLLLHLLTEVGEIDSFTVMVQLEVARRLVAEPGSPDYGLASVVTRIHGRPRLAFTVPPQVFYPPPRVESAVVHVLRGVAPPFAARAIQLAGAAFRQRRKMLRGSLRSVMADPETALTVAGIEPTRRPQTLTAEDFLRLAEVAA
jgi:16S rRNA (adenine1518-N6/adenine1519-N6)-dimethyltransferase